MKFELTDIEARVLGALIEKESTTPENYPLSLNSLTNACNQKTNREPLMTLAESDVHDAVEGLAEYTLLARRAAASSRVDKFAHRLNSRLGDEYSFQKADLAVLCLLMLRGPQTVGELRTRSTRIYAFTSGSEVEQTLAELENRDDGPFVIKLDRLPGHKEARFAHLWCGLPEIDYAVPAQASGEPSRIAALEAQVSDLERRIELLEQAATDQLE